MIKSIITVKVQHLLVWTARTQQSTLSVHRSSACWPPFPQIDIIGAMVIAWRARGKIIRSVLCSIVCNNCTQ